jgi:hypothetical protein
VSLCNELMGLYRPKGFLSALVDTLGLGDRHALALAFANWLLELRGQPEHSEHQSRGWIRAAGKCKTVLHKLDRDSAFVKFPDDPAEVVVNAELRRMSSPRLRYPASAGFFLWLNSPG